jgi:hypothetical protein
MLRCSVDLGKVFTIPATDMENGRPTYRFCGVICYYGLHYVSLFARRCQNKKSQNYGQWLLFDDARIHALSNWNAVKAFCVKAHYQPTVVWFERVPEGEAPWWDDDEPEVPLIHQAAEEEVSITSSAMSLLNGIVDGVSDGVSSLAKPLVGDHTAVPRKQHTRPSHTANPISSSSSSSPSWSFEEGQGMKSKKEWSFDQGKGDRGDIYPRKSQATSHFGNDQAKPDRGEVYPRKSQLISQPDYITVSHEDRYRQPLAPKSKPTQAEAKLMEVDEPQDKSQVPESRTRLGTSGTSGNGGESSEGGGHARPKRFQAESKLMEADEPQDKSHVPDSRTHRGINGGASGEKNPAADPSCSLPKPPESTPPPAYSSLKGPLAKSQIDEPEDTEDVYVMPKMNNTHELVPTTSPRYNVSINYAPDSNQPGKHYLGTPRSTFQGSGLICDVVEDDGILRVKAFSKLGNGEYLLPLEIRSRINIGDRLVSVSGKLLSGQSVNMARSNIEHAAKYSFMMRKGTPAIFELKRFRG